MRSMMSSHDRSSTVQLLWKRSSVFCGSQRIPALFRSMGRAKGEFQQGLREGLVGPSETERDLDRGGMTESHAEE